MKEILVAVDGCAHSDEIVDCAIGLAKSISAKILLVNVQPKTHMPDEYRDSHGDAFPEHYYEDLSIQATRDVRRRIEAAKIDFEDIHGVGDVVKFILSLAKERSPNFLVVGIHGLHYLGRVRAVGGVARSLIENSPVPVIVVPWTRSGK